MERIDNFCIDRIFQPIADWLQDLTRRSTYYLAACSYAGISLISLLLSYLHFGGSVLLSLIYFLCSFVAMSPIRTQIRRDNNLHEHPSKVVENDRHDSVLVILRPVLVCMFVAVGIPYIVKKLYADTLTLADIIGEIFSILLIAAYYFAACTPKPPAPKKQEVPNPTPA